MKAYSVKHGFGDKVIFTGFTKNIGKYILASDIGVSTSISEGLGLGLAEQMCCGKPVVLSQIRGHNELVQDGYNGIFFRLDDRKGLINGIKKLCADVQLRTEMGLNGQAYMERFMLENTMPQTTKVYEQLLGLDVQLERRFALAF